MGCCLSTLEENKTKPKPNSNNNTSLDKTHPFSCVSKSPPRPEEETVKEVLSETPKLKPKPNPSPKPQPQPEPEPELESKPEPEILKKEEEEEESTKPNNIVLPSPKKPNPVQKQPKPKIIEPVTPEEISEVSEIQSMSETISTTTLEDNNQHQQWAVKDSATSGQRRSRSQGGQNTHLSYPPKTHGRSPVRKRVDPSPPRRRYPGGPGQGQGRENPNPARRSRSPAARANVGRSPSGRRAGPSPGRVRMVNGPESVRKVEEEEVKGKNGNGNGNGDESEMDGPKESLENPLVSLECFIFL